jgi:iron complex outermembrane receptor protein
MRHLLSTTALWSGLVLAAPALAQTAPPPATRPASDVVVVTGTRLQAASDSGAVAVSIIGRDQIDALGQSGTGEILENLA